MVRICIIFIGLLLSFICINAQIVDTIWNNKIIDYIEDAPHFKGDLMSFIQKEINYPKSALKDYLEGTVIVSLWVEQDGRTSNHEVTNGIRNDLNEEALRVARLIIFAKPAMQKGKPIRVKYLIPVKFEMQNCSDSVKVFGNPEELPIFNKESPGIDKLFEFIAENIKYPESALNDQMEGRVIIEFWINTIGITSNHRVDRSVRKDLDDEALRIAKLIRFDIPAMNNGKAVGICFRLPISFKLPKESNTASLLLSDSTICDKFFRDLESRKAELQPNFYSRPPFPKENSIPILCELCEIFSESSKDFVAVALLLDKTGIPMCINVSPKSLNDSLKNEIIKLLYRMEFEPALGGYQDPVVSEFHLVINSKKCEMYKNMNRQKKRKK